VHDGVDTGYRGIDTIALQQVTGHVFDAIGGLAVAPAQQPNRIARLQQQRRDVAAEGAGTAGEQDGRGHWSLRSFRTGRVGPIACPFRCAA
jgi:hypothetical protein